MVTAGILIGLSGSSLWSTRRAWRKLRAGEGSYEELLDVTGLFDRNRLLKIPGVSVGAKGRLAFDPAHLSELRPHGIAQWLGTPLGDVFTILAAVASVVLYAVGKESWSWPLISTAGTYVLASWVAGFYLFFRHADSNELE